MTSTTIALIARTPHDVLVWSRASQYESRLRRQQRSSRRRVIAATVASLVTLALGVFYATGPTP